MFLTNILCSVISTFLNKITRIVSFCTKWQVIINIIWCSIWFQIIYKFNKAAAEDKIKAIPPLSWTYHHSLINYHCSMFIYILLSCLRQFLCLLQDDSISIRVSLFDEEPELFHPLFLTPALLATPTSVPQLWHICFPLPILSFKLENNFWHIQTRLSCTVIVI